MNPSLIALLAVTGWVPSARLAIPAFLWVAVVFVVFHDKAYTIDDPFFLAQANQVLESPLDPSGFDIVWGTQYGHASEVSPTGPGMAYLLTATAALGGAEWAAHATVFGFLALAAWGVIALAGRLGATPGEARWVSLLLLCIPTVLAMAGTAMPDVPAMAAGVLGMERLLAFRSDRRGHQGAAAMLALGAAILIRSHALMLLPVAAFFLVGAEVRTGRWSRVLDPRRLWPVIGSLLVALGIAWLTRDSATGVTNFATSLDFLKTVAVPRHLMAFFFHFVLALPFALAWAAMRFRNLSWRLYLIVALLLAVAVPTHRAWAAPFAAFAAVALFDAVRSAWRSREVDRIALALWLVATLPVVVYVHLPSKYLVISAPAVALLVVFEARSRSPRFRRNLGAAWLVGGSALGLLILQADAHLASLGREAATSLVAPQTAQGRTVWYAGSWGFHWYAESAGAVPLGADPEGPKPGDYIAYSSFRSGALGEHHFGRRVKQVSDSGPGGRVMDKSRRIGFYSDGYGFLPWGWADDIVDQYELWQVAAAPPNAGARRPRAGDPSP